MFKNEKRKGIFFFQLNGDTGTVIVNVLNSTK